jgi:hypothetical protein
MSDTEKIIKRLKELSHAATLPNHEMLSEFTMQVPADPERDADLVLSRAAQEISRLQAENDSLAEANSILNSANYTDGVRIKGLMADIKAANNKLDKARECLKQIDYWNDDPKHFSKFLNDLLKQALKDTE